MDPRFNLIKEYEQECASAELPGRRNNRELQPAPASQQPLRQRTKAGPLRLVRLIIRHYSASARMPGDHPKREVSRQLSFGLSTPEPSKMAAAAPSCGDTGDQDSIAGSPSSTSPHLWRLNETLLNNPVHCIMLEKELCEYFLLNDKDDISPSSLWGAHKAVMRGKIIQLASRVKHEWQVDVANLEKGFKSLSKAHKHNSTSDSFAKLEASRMTLNSSAEKHLRCEWSVLPSY